MTHIKCVSLWLLHSFGMTYLERNYKIGRKWITQLLSFLSSPSSLQQWSKGRGKRARRQRKGYGKSCQISNSTMKMKLLKNSLSYELLESKSGQGRGEAGEDVLFLPPPYWSPGERFHLWSFLISLAPLPCALPATQLWLLCPASLPPATSAPQLSLSSSLMTRFCVLGCPAGPSDPSGLSSIP